MTLAHCRKPNRIYRTLKTNLSCVCGLPVHFLVALYSLVSEREFRKCSGIVISSQRHSTLAQLALTFSWLWRQDFLVTFAHCRKSDLARPPCSSNGSSL